MFSQMLCPQSSDQGFLNSFHLRRSNSQLSSLQEFVPLLFTLCKDIYISFVPLHICHWLESWCLQEQVFCYLQLSWKDKHDLLPVSPYANTAVHSTTCQPLSLLFYFLHRAIQSLEIINKPSIFSVLGAWDIYKKMTAPEKLLRRWLKSNILCLHCPISRKLSDLCSQVLLSTKGWKSKFAFPPLPKWLLVTFFFNPSHDTVLYKLLATIPLFTP